MIVLGCETSCDETGLALYDTAAGLLAHALYSQADLHALYGGVVPELASRDHIRRIVPLLESVLQDAGITAAQIDGVGYTAGPGLAGALMTGALAGRALAWGLGRPAVAVHHMEAHLLAPMLESPAPDFPFVCLLVSGGHTLLVHVDGVGRYRILGESIDDAAGEAFDKTAKLLGLGYPGGPALAGLAATGDATAVSLPRPMLDRPGLDVSFSGLKTAVVTRHRAWQKAGVDAPDRPDADRWCADLAASFEAALVDTLVQKSARALAQQGLTRLVVSGGVSANTRLRTSLHALATQQGFDVFYPRLEFCTDNGAMIALTAALRLQAGESTGLEVRIRPRWPLNELRPPGEGAAR